MKPTAAIFGGVAGTSAAHALAGQGFRFSPGFYRHITDARKRISYAGNRQDVFDNPLMANRMRPAGLVAFTVAG